MIQQLLRRIFSVRIRIETVDDKSDTANQSKVNIDNHNQSAPSSSPGNKAHANNTSQGLSRPESDTAVDLTSLDVVSENRNVDAPICITNYQDLLLASKNKPNLGRLSEYPPQPRSIDAVTVDEIMAFFSEAIRQGADDLPMERQEIDELFLPVVRRGLMYMHLLPASQFHHHNGIGGLFAHSLEVANLAVRLGKQKVFNQKDTPRELYQNGKRWLFGCWLSGFLHDIGKAVTDVTVTSEGETWYPYTASLTHWLQSNNLKSYHFIWRSAGHNRHQQSTLMFVREIIPPQTFEWLADFGARDIWEACESALLDPSAKDNLISEVVQKADEFTSGKDINDRNTGMIDPHRMGGSLPAAEYIMDALHLLISEGALEINGRGSILRVTTAGTFIIWTTKASELIYKKVLEEKHSSVPRKIDRMLECLVTGGIVEPTPESFTGMKGYIWPVIYDMHPSQPLKSIKIRNTQVLFNGIVPPSPELAIVNGWENQDPNNIASWENKHGKLFDDSAKEEIPAPPPEEVSQELVNQTDLEHVLENELPKNVGNEVVCEPSASEPKTIEKQETPEEKAAFAAQIKSVLSGQAVVDIPKPSPEKTGCMTSSLEPYEKPSSASVKDAKTRFEAGDLSFLAPSMSTNDMKDHGVVIQSTDAPKHDTPTVTLSANDILSNRPVSELNSKPNKPHKAYQNLSPVVVGGKKAKQDKRVQKTNKADTPRPMLNGKPISKRPPKADPLLSAELMAVFTGQASPTEDEKIAVQARENTPKKESNPKSSEASSMDMQNVSVNSPEPPKQIKKTPDNAKKTLVSNVKEQDVRVQVVEAKAEHIAPLSSGEEDKTQNSDSMLSEFSDAFLDEAPYIRSNVEEEKSFVSKTEALKYEKRMKTIEAQNEQSIVCIQVGDEARIVDSNKAISNLKSIEKNNGCKTSEGTQLSDEVSNEKPKPTVQNQLMSLRQEIIDQMMAGEGNLFPSGLISITETERKAFAEGIYDRGKAIGIDARKITAIASGFQPGRFKLSIQTLNKRPVVTLKLKDK